MNKNIEKQLDDNSTLWFIRTKKAKEIVWWSDKDKKKKYRGNKWRYYFITVTTISWIRKFVSSESKRFASQKFSQLTWIDENIGISAINISYLDSLQMSRLPWVTKL